MFWQHYPNVLGALVVAIKKLRSVFVDRNFFVYINLESYFFILKGFVVSVRIK